MNNQVNLLNTIQSVQENIEIFDSYIKGEIIDAKDLSSIIIIRSKIHNMNFNDCVLDAAMFYENQFESVKFKNCDFNKAELKESQFINCQFENCNIRKSEFYDSLFLGTNTFINSSLQSTSFGLCDLRNVRFINADIENTRFYESKMYGVKFDKLNYNLDFSNIFKNIDVTELGNNSLLKNGKETLSFFVINYD